MATYQQTAPSGALYWVVDFVWADPHTGAKSRVRRAAKDAKGRPATSRTAAEQHEYRLRTTLAENSATAKLRPALPRAIHKRKRPLAALLQEQAQFLCAVEILDVGTKIGITSAPERRLQAHVAAARHGRQVGRTWVSSLHLEARDNERALIASEDHGTEYLRAPFDEVMARVVALPMTVPVPAETSEAA